MNITKRSMDLLSLRISSWGLLCHFVWPSDTPHKHIGLLHSSARTWWAPLSTETWTSLDTTTCIRQPVDNPGSLASQGNGASPTTHKNQRWAAKAAKLEKMWNSSLLWARNWQTNLFVCIKTRHKLFLATEQSLFRKPTLDYWQCTILEQSSRSLQVLEKQRSLSSVSNCQQKVFKNFFKNLWRINCVFWKQRRGLKSWWEGNPFFWRKLPKMHRF